MSDSITRFWDKYIEKSTVYGLKAHVICRHVIYAEAYIKAYAKQSWNHIARSE